MAERHAKDGSTPTTSPTAALLVLFFVLQIATPLAVADGAELDDMAICSSPLGLGGVCDSRTDAADGTEGDSWVEGMYFFNMTSPTTLEFQASWAIREWDKSALDMFNSNAMAAALQSDNIGSDDGLPADVLRASFDNNTIPDDPDSPTVEETLLSEIDGSISSLLASWGGTTTPDTNWTQRISLPDGFGGSTSVNCTTDVNENTDGNAFEPPICISTNVTITLPILGTYGLTGVSANSLDAALEGLLVMGSEVTTTFTVNVEAGFKGTYAIQPPSYATIAGVQGTGASRIFENSSDPYHSGLWVVDNLNPPGAGFGSLPGNLIMTLGFRETTFTNVVDIDPETRSLELHVILDMADEQSTTIEVIAGLYQIQSATLESWGVKPLMSKEKANIPVITSDGIRMAYDTGLLNIEDLAEAVPISGVGEAIGSSVEGLDIQMGSFEWVSIAESPLDPGGLNYTHFPPCLFGDHYCTQGTVAMDDSYPVYLKSTSHTFPLSLAGLLGGNLGEDAGFLNSVSGSDLGLLLNSGVEFSTVLSDETMDEFVGSMLPAGVNADLTFEIVLPTWASTKNGGESILLSYRVSGEHDSEISLTGSESFDWRHPLCTSGSEGCNDDRADAFCTSTMKSCASSTVDLDISDFSVATLPVSKGATMEFSLTVNMSIHRIGVPDSFFASMNTETTNVSLDVLPSDLLRLIVDVAGRGEAPLEQEFSICDSGKSYCSQKIRFSNDETTGLPAFAEQFGQDLTTMLRDEAAALSADQNSSIGNFDLTHFSIETELTGLIDQDSTVGDEEGIVLSVHIPRVRVTAGLDNSWGELLSIIRGDAGVTPKLGVSTDVANALVAPFFSPVVGAMEGLTGALSASVVSAQGIQSPVVLSSSTGGVNTTINEEMGLSVTGELRLTLPLGITLQNLTSSDGLITQYTDEETSRQVIVYYLKAGEQTDEISFVPMVGWNWVFAQLLYYFGAIGAFFSWRVRAKSVKRKRKRRKRQLEQQVEAVESAGRVFVPQTPTVEVLKVTDNGIVIKKRVQEVAGA